MAKIPIEIVNIGGISVEKIEVIVAVLNELQDAFTYNVLSDNKASIFQGASGHRFTTKEIYEFFGLLKQRIKGYHPHLIGLVERQLDGKRLGNLFGSMKQERNDLQGMAIASLHQIPSLLHPVPVDVYVVFELLSFAIRFLHGEGMIHPETRQCIFDQKIDKTEIVKAIKIGHFCRQCEKIISTHLDSDQEIAVDRIFKVVRDIANSNAPGEAWIKETQRVTKPIPKVFLCHSSRDKKFVKRLAGDLVNQRYRVWFDAWEICVGDNIVQKINSGLQDSGFLVVVLSQSSTESEWVEREWTSKFMMAAESRKATVIPILLEACDIPPLLHAVKFADFRHPQNYTTALKDVIKAIENGIIG